MACGATLTCPACGFPIPLEFLTTEEVWAYLLQKPNPWGGDNRSLYRLYANASSGECPIQIDTSTPSCGSSRFGCWTCTVVDRDKASEGLLASGDDRMEKLIEFRETLLYYRDPANGKRDNRRMNGNEGPGPSSSLLDVNCYSVSWPCRKRQGATDQPRRTAFDPANVESRPDPDDGRGVARIVNKQRGAIMSADLKELNRLRELEEEVAREKGINADSSAAWSPRSRNTAKATAPTACRTTCSIS